jgi:hypothetical protein
VRAQAAHSLAFSRWLCVAQARARVVDPDDDTDDTVERRVAAQPSSSSASSAQPGATGRHATFLAGLKWSPRCFSRSVHPLSAFTLPDRLLLEGTDAAWASMALDVSGGPGVEVGNAECHHPMESSSSRGGGACQWARCSHSSRHRHLPPRLHRNVPMRNQSIFQSQFWDAGYCHRLTSFAPGLRSASSDLLGGHPVLPVQELVGLLDDAQSYSDSLRGFTREELELMAEVGRCVVVAEGGVLVREDAPAHVVGVLLSGLADVRCSRNKQVASLQVRRMTPCLGKGLPRLTQAKARVWMQPR